MPVADPVSVLHLVGGVNDNSAAYDLVLLAHVLTAVVALVAVVVAAGFALALRGALRAGGMLPVAVVRYFRPGVNWVGRVLFLVPVLGFALIAMSGGQWGWSDAWVTVGLGVWVVVAMAAEGILWPAERQLQEVVASRAAGGAPADPIGPDGGGAPADTEALCLRAGLLGIGLAVALLAAAVVMVAKP